MSITLLKFLLIAMIPILVKLKDYLFHSKKEKFSDLSSKYVDALEDVRLLTGLEITAIYEIYGIRVAPGDRVKHISGKYSHHTLINRRGQIKDRYISIGDVLLYPDNHLLSYIRENNEADIVDLGPEYGVAVISMNNIYTIMEETCLRTVLQEEISYTMTGNNEYGTSGIKILDYRKLLEKERSWLFSDYRSSLVFLSVLLAAGSVMSLGWVIQSALILSSLLLFIFKVLPSNKTKLQAENDKKLVHISGLLVKCDNKIRMGRFYLQFPRYLVDKLPTSHEVTIEAYPLDDNWNELKVLSLDSEYTLRRGYKKQNTVNHDRFKLFSLLTIAAVLVLLFSTDIYNEASHVFHFHTTKNKQSDFSDFHQLKQYDLAIGQPVNLKEIPSLLKLDGGFYLFDEPIPSAIELRKTRTLIENINELQKTPEMVDFFASISFLNSEEYHKFKSLNSNMNGKYSSISEIKEYFDHSPSFQVIYEITEIIKSLPEKVKADRPIDYSSESALYAFTDGATLSVRTLLYIMRSVWHDFIQEEAAEIKIKLYEDYEGLIEGKEIVEIITDESAQTIFLRETFSLLIDRYLSVFDTNRIANRGSYIQEEDFREPIGALEELDILEQSIRSYSGKIYCDGIIDNIEKKEEIVSRITVDEYFDYSIIPEYTISTIMFILMTGIAILALSLWLKARGEIH